MAEQSSDDGTRQQLRAFRSIVADVVTELRSQEVRDTYAALTLSELLDQHLTKLVGDGKTPSRKQRLQTMFDAYNANIDAIKATSPALFRQHDPERDVNTAPDGS